jgi:hypothetical protein
MAIDACNPSIMGGMRVGLELLCPFGNGCVTFVAFQTRFPFRDLGRTFISMAILARNPKFAVYVINLLLLLGHSRNREHKQEKNHKNSYQNSFSIHPRSIG